jgi:predicted glycoside hydrolase/deacetylase ChbG (UPF0249 family)
VKYCIVNGDDFGASRGINRGILEAHREGVLTSTSMIVNLSASEHAAALGRQCPDLSVGLHVNIEPVNGAQAADLSELASVRRELDHQVERFQALMGTLPTHLDSHHNIHRSPGLTPLFQELAEAYRMPLREGSPVRYFSKFYGQWDGETHLEQISVEALLAMVRHEIGDGVSELSCHPGYPDPGFRTSYAKEREVELATLCDPRLRSGFDALGVRLINYRALAEVTGHGKRVGHGKR